MIRTLGGLVLAFTLLAACAAEAPVATAPPAHEPAEEAAVLAATDLYFATLSSNDADDLVGQQVAEGMTFRALRDSSGGWSIEARPSSYWVDPSNDPEVSYRARYWSPEVLIRGPVAVVWTPYEFWLNGEPHHCGVNALTLTKQEGTWKIANAAWTVEPDACEGLRPESQDALRPVQ
jgi:hypothetical protein